MKPIRRVALGLVLLLAACQPNGQPPSAARPGTAGSEWIRARRVAFHREDSDAVVLEKGRALVGDAFSMLSSNLMEALAAGGPSNAIPFCARSALPLTERLAEANAVTLRRVSHRARNPSNAPTPAELAVLEELQQAHAAGRPLGARIDRAGDTLVFYAPIVINNQLCLNCHGEPGLGLSPETHALLKTLYPQDQATGFKMNDLRGMWVIGVTAAATDAP